MHNAERDAGEWGWAVSTGVSRRLLSAVASNEGDSR